MTGWLIGITIGYLVVTAIAYDVIFDHKACLGISRWSFRQKFLGTVFWPWMLIRIVLHGLCTLILMLAYNVHYRELGEAMANNPAKHVWVTWLIKVHTRYAARTIKK